MPKTKSWPARPALTERTSKRPRLHTAAMDEPQTVVQPTSPQVSTSPVELSAPQSPTTSVCAIPVTEPTVPKGNLTLVSLNSNHTILTLTVGSSQFPLKYYVGPSTRDKMIHYIWDIARQEPKQISCFLHSCNICIWPIN